VPIHIHHGVLLFLAALVAGAINSVAGGGSFISFPALLFVGLPPVNANASNTVALWPGQPASLGAYRGEFQHLSRGIVVQLIMTGIVGGLLGAWVLLITPQTTFLRLVPWLILTATVIFSLSGRITRWVRRRSSEQAQHAEFTTVRGIVLQLLIAFYIGYFGAGVGILILAMLALLGMDQIHTMNALKALLTTVANGVATVLFILSHAVYWPETLLMIVGSVVGGYFGAYYAQKTKPAYVKMMVIAIGFALSAYYFARQIRG
jgi:uncharacterized membrane protein YfcA